MVGRIIGKNGETVKALQSFSGAQIQVDQSTEPCRVSISGPPYSLSLAVSMVQDIISGSFKGFALLRQTSRPATGDSSLQLPRPGQQYPSNQHLQFQQQQNEPRPVYAPGYGLIPASQVRACDGTHRWSHTTPPDRLTCGGLSNSSPDVCSLDMLQLYEERSTVPTYGPRGLMMEAQMNLLQGGYPMQGGRPSSGYMAGAPSFGPMGLMGMTGSQGGLYADDGGAAGLGHGYNDMLGGNSYTAMGLDPSGPISPYLMAHGLGNSGNPLTNNLNLNNLNNSPMMHPAMAAALGSNGGGSGGGGGREYGSNSGSRDNSLDYSSLTSQQRLMQMSAGNSNNGSNGNNGNGGGPGMGSRPGGGRGQGGYSGRRGAFLG
ncbi:MAG: hypothetical protein WDW38_010761 [Sanguina aurantia]